MWLSVSLAAVLFVVDLILKAIVIIREPLISFLFVDFKLFKNTGLAFSIQAPQSIYLPIAIAVFLIFFTALIFAFHKRSVTLTALSFIVLGALSNMIDRFIHQATIDYLIIFERSAINIADIMIVVGVIMFIRVQKQIGNQQKTISK